ncbi:MULTISPECIES: adenine nucleotide alpha hydrolase [Falsihalocynthiibacter]|uniref:adenine nucleotide alpha hydrolase n=1 Tax=Falsihalocynthiibacter TaxID=2854182 RepID=UPI003001D795
MHDVPKALEKLATFQRLRKVVMQSPNLTVAVSGGVDSLTLATIAGRINGQVTVAHALSPAVPSEATQRVIDMARTENWTLKTLNAREFDDPNYIKNPHNRCYFCKSNLYARIRQECHGDLAAGTNLDDLGEYRPGLIAAKENNVLHPFVEAKIDKSELRNFARLLGLPDIATLPAQPCLASRVETGIAISAGDLALIHKIETAAATMMDADDIRCRLTPNGLRLDTSSKPSEAALQAVKTLCEMAGKPFVGHAAYSRGSAFIMPISS